VINVEIRKFETSKMENAQSPSLKFVLSCDC